MNSRFINERITELRLKKGVSEYKMSLDLGHSKGYIQSISSGRTLPSLSEFLYICEYFEISPSDFFSTEAQNSVPVETLLTICSSLNCEDIQVLIRLAQHLKHIRGKGEQA